MPVNNRDMLRSGMLVNGFSLPSRLCIQPMNSNDCVSGFPSELTIDRYRRYARSGAGLVIVEHGLVAYQDAWRPNNLLVDQSRASGIARLVEAFKGENAESKLMFHISAPAPSPQALLAKPSCRGPSAETLSRKEIRELVTKYVDAARVVEAAGGDGVELKVSHMSILMNFLMPRNRREDEYGGSLRNRMRVLLEIIDGIRSHTDAEKFKVGIRMTMYGGVPGGMGTVGSASAEEDLREACSTLVACVDAGAEFLNISMGDAHVTKELMSPVCVPVGFSLRNLDSFDMFRYAAIARAHVAARTDRPFVVIGSGFSTFGQAMADVMAANIRGANMDLVGIGRQAFIDANLDHIIAGTFEPCELCNKCFDLCLNRWQIPSGCVRLEPYASLIRRLDGDSGARVDARFFPLLRHSLTRANEADRSALLSCFPDA
jgi:2,4-dienoyl-CoA reductase-like NADH-dependent reductase (Old Yellow Enzyme family)